ncbi:MAG: hypothetical protein Kow00127_08050 [Bacteroidales bacterium]
MKQVAYIFLLTSFLLNSGNIFAQEPDSVLTGTITYPQLLEGEYASWFMPEYGAYHPDREILNKLTPALYSYDILLVMGTWCHDSQMQVPRLFKILDQLDYNTSLIRIVCLDYEKQAPGFDPATYSIERIPTIILLKNSREAGRITESPEETIEKDLLRIISGNK